MRGTMHTYLVPAQVITVLRTYLECCFGYIMAALLYIGCIIMYWLYCGSIIIGWGRVAPLLFGTNEGVAPAVLPTTHSPCGKH